jgi:hypothetical protein
VAKAKDELFDHDFDGIQEFDNDLPGWWKALFYISIVVAGIYLIHYHVLKTGDLPRVEYLKTSNPDAVVRTGPLAAYHSPYFNREGDLTPRIEAEFDRLATLSFETHLIQAMSRADADQLTKLQAAFPDVYATFLEGGIPSPRASARPTRARISVPEGLELLLTTEELGAGGEIYQANCATCHGNRGQGGIGPNLTDAYWIHGASMDAVIRTIYVGIPAKGMIAWYGTLDETQVQQVASYILADLMGSNPPNPKGPEGEQVP